MIGELTRLYQAALEEQRRVNTHIDAGDGQADELVRAGERIDLELERAETALFDAYYRRPAA